MVLSEIDKQGSGTARITYQGDPESIENDRLEDQLDVSLAKADIVVTK